MKVNLNSPVLNRNYAMHSDRLLCWNSRL